MAVLIFIAILVAYIWGEFAVFATVSHTLGDFGPLLVIAATIATAIIGVRLFRRTGAGTLQRLAADTMRGGPPFAGIADGGAIIAAAGLLLMPGFITDTLGLVLFIPGLRTWLMLGIFAIAAKLAIGAKFAKNHPPGGGQPPPRGGVPPRGGEPSHGNPPDEAKKPSEVIIEGEFERKS